MVALRFLFSPLLVWPANSRPCMGRRHSATEFVHISKCQNCLLLRGRAIFCCVDIPHFFKIHFTSHGFHILTVVTCVPANTGEQISLQDLTSHLSDKYSEVESESSSVFVYRDYHTVFQCARNPVSPQPADAHWLFLVPPRTPHWVVRSTSLGWQLAVVLEVARPNCTICRCL